MAAASVAAFALLLGGAHAFSPSRPVLPHSKHALRRTAPFSCAPPELPSKNLLGAISKLDGRVTAADVAAETGVGISETQRQLLVLARLVGAELVVADDGQLMFVFEDKAALRRGLRRATWRMRGREAWDTVSPALAWTARASFGLGLLASVTLVVSAITVLSASKDGDSSSSGSVRVHVHA